MDARSIVLACVVAGCSAEAPPPPQDEDWVLERLVKTLHSERGSVLLAAPTTWSWNDEFGWWDDLDEDAEALWASNLRGWSKQLAAELPGERPDAPAASEAWPRMSPLAESEARSMLIELRALNSTTRTWEPSPPLPARLRLDESRLFENYFVPGGGGWDRWYREHPESAGYLRLSRPIIDARHGLVLLYGQLSFDVLAGYSWLGLYRIVEDRLEDVRFITISES